MAVRSLGQLTLDVIAKTGGFTGPMEKMDRSTRRQMESVKKSIGVGVTALAGLSVAAASAAGTGVVMLTRAGMENIDQMAKLARQLDSTIGGVRALQLAANDAGVATSVIDSAMERFSARLGEAMRGTGQAKEALDGLGLSADDLANMDVDQRVATIADRVKELGLNGAETADMLRQFGIRNREIVNLMRQGGDAIRNARDEIEDYGLAIDAVDAATIEAANDALSRGGLVVESLRNSLAVELAPIVLEVADRFNEAAREAGGMGEMVQGAVETAASAVALLLDKYRDWQILNQRVEVGTADMELAFAQFAANSWNYMSDFLDGTIEKVNTLISVLNHVKGVDIDLITSFSESEFLGNINSRMEQALGKRNLAQLELNDLISAEKPSAAIDRLFDDIEERRKQIAENAKNDPIVPPPSDPPPVDPPGGGGGGGNSSGSGSSRVDTAARDAAREAERAAREQARAIEQQRDAYSRLLDQLYPVQAAQEQFREEMELLEAANAAGAIDDIADAQRRLKEASADDMLRGMQDAPGFGGLDASIGGAFGELNKIDQQQGELETWYETQLEMLDEFREQRAELSQQWDEREREIQQQHQDQLLAIEQARGLAQMAAAESTFGDLAGITEAFAGKQSGIYRSLFAIEKSFAIGKALMNVPQSYSDAYAAVVGIPVVGPALAPAAGAAAAAAQVAQAASIKNIGMAHDGIDRIPKEGTWLLDQGERVLNRPQADKLDAFLANQKGGGGGNVTVNLMENPGKAGQVEQRQNDDGSTNTTVFVADIRGRGQRAKVLEQTYGLKRQGQ